MHDGLSADFDAELRADQPSAGGSAARRPTSAYLRTILSAVQDGITVQDASGALVYANDAAARLIGLPSGDAMVAASLPEVLAAFDVLDARGEPLGYEDLPGREALRSGQDAERLLRYRNRTTGEERWSIVRSRAVRDGTGAIAMVVNAFQDISELMRHEQKLEETMFRLEQTAAQLGQTVEELQEQKAEALRSRELARAAEQRSSFLAEAGRLLVASLDAEATLRAIARLAVPRIADWCTIHVLSEGTEIRRLEIAHADPGKLAFVQALEQQFPPPRDESSAMVRALRTGESQLYEDVTDDMLAAAAANDRHLEMLRELQLRSAMVVPLKTGPRVLGVLTLVATAESGRRYSAADLELAEELARRAAIAIHHAELYEDAQAANLAKANFLAVMSHELRTPLTAIVGNADLLDLEVWGEINPRQRDRVNRIKASARHLMAIIDEILTFARLEAATEQLQIEEVDVGELVAETLDMLDTDARDRELRLTSRVTPAPVRWNTDPNKLRQILVNLVGNAIKFTESGVIEVEVAADTSAGGSLALRIRDTGPGIPADEQERIFQPFTQVDESRTRAKGGTGLGLPVSRRLARLLGGDLTLESGSGGGSTFTIVLPQHEV